MTDTSTPADPAAVELKDASLDQLANWLEYRACSEEGATPDFCELAAKIVRAHQSPPVVAMGREAELATVLKLARSYMHAAVSGLAVNPFKGRDDLRIVDAALNAASTPAEGLGPQQKPLSEAFSGFEMLRERFAPAEGRDMGEVAREKAVEQILLTTMDPTVEMHGKPLPAMSTMLHRICDNDGEQFEEATRLVGLFIEAALSRPAPSGGVKDLLADLLRLKAHHQFTRDHVVRGQAECQVRQAAADFCDTIDRAADILSRLAPQPPEAS